MTDPDKIATRRLGFLRWEATQEIKPYAWLVAYGRTRRGALRSLGRRSNPRVPSTDRTEGPS